LPAGYLGTTGQAILTSQHNPIFEDVAQALTGSLPRDGTAPMQANLPMSGFKVTGLANGVDPQDAATVAQIEAASSVESEINAATVKAVMVDADRMPLTDSADGFSLKRATFANLKSSIRTAFDTVYLLVSDVATAAQYRANTAGKVLRTGEVWSAMAVVALTDAATIVWDMSSGFDFSVTIAGNRTLGNPSNTQVGKKGRIKVTASGTRTLAKSSNIKSTTTFPISIASGTSAYLYYDCVSSTEIIVNVVNGPS
jgi:hypothetical protein